MGKHQHWNENINCHDLSVGRRGEMFIKVVKFHPNLSKAFCSILGREESDTSWYPKDLLIKLTGYANNFTTANIFRPRSAMRWRNIILRIAFIYLRINLVKISPIAMLCMYPWRAAIHLLPSNILSVTHHTTLHVAVSKMCSLTLRIF